MSRIMNLQYAASMEALKSNCENKHGSIITKGNKIYAKGYNTNMRGSFQGKLDCCMHAEMFCANQFINNVVRVNKKKYCLKWNKKKRRIIL